MLNLDLPRERAHSHWESPTDAPTKRDSTLFVVLSTETPFSNKLSAIESLCFFSFAFVENSDWMVSIRPAMERYDAV